tara:strand:- start:83 stop:424 length:342 start_codon:yes stop_codon:yes gene_type:complete
MTSFYKLMSTSSHPIDSGKYVDNIKIGKKKVVKVVNALEKLKQLQTLQFRYKEEFNPDQRLRAGFSAQQVQEVIPEAVFEVDGYLMLDMDVLKAYVREAKKELKKINNIRVKL